MTEGVIRDGLTEAFNDCRGRGLREGMMAIVDALTTVLRPIAARPR